MSRPLQSALDYLALIRQHRPGSKIARVDAGEAAYAALVEEARKQCIYESREASTSLLIDGVEFRRSISVLRWELEGVLLTAIGVEGMPGFRWAEERAHAWLIPSPPRLAAFDGHGRHPVDVVFEEFLDRAEADVSAGLARAHAALEATILLEGAEGYQEDRARVEAGAPLPAETWPGPPDQDEWRWVRHGDGWALMQGQHSRLHGLNRLTVEKDGFDVHGAELRELTARLLNEHAERKRCTP